MLLLLIWCNNVPSWVGGSQRDGSEHMALSSAARICSLVKYLLIFTFAFCSVPHHLLLFTRPQNNIKRLFPTVALKTRNR